MGQYLLHFRICVILIAHRPTPWTEKYSESPICVTQSMLCLLLRQHIIFACASNQLIYAEAPEYSNGPIMICKSCIGCYSTSGALRI